MEKEHISASKQAHNLVCCFVLLFSSMLVALVGGFLGGIYLNNKIVDVQVSVVKEWTQKYTDIQGKVEKLEAENVLLRGKLEVVSYTCTCLNGCVNIKYILGFAAQEPRRSCLGLVSS